MGAQCWTSTSSTNAYPIQTTFIVGEQVYVYWQPYSPSNGAVDIKVYSPDAVPGVSAPYCQFIAVYPASQPVTFVPNQAGTWILTCNGCSTAITVTPVFVVPTPENPAGSLIAFAACFGTLAVAMKTKLRSLLLL